MKNINEKPPQQPLVFFKTDQAGYFINEADIKNIKKPWADVIEDIKQVLSKYIADKLHSVYIYAEFAKGKSTKGHGDFWVLIVTTEEINVDWLNEYRQYLIGKYPFTSKLILRLETYDRVMGSESYKFSIKTEYVCIYGSNIALKIDKFKPNAKLCFRTIRYLEGIPLWYQHLVANKENGQEILKLSSILPIMFLQVGLEICIEREKKYTHDLYTSYRIFSKYYPEQEPLMRRAYYLSQEATSDGEELLDLFNTLGKWLMAIIKLNMVENELKRGKIV